MLTLLSLDWDWVTGDCAANQHGCCGWCEPPTLGRGRTRGSVNNLFPFWKTRVAKIMEIKFTLGADFWVTECHADILRVLNPERCDRILHLDSHPDDADYFALSCGSWRTFLPKNIEVIVNEISEPIHGVFICKSSPWTPSEMDREFWQLIQHISEMIGREPEFIGHKRSQLAREWEQNIERPQVAF